MENMNNFKASGGWDNLISELVNNKVKSITMCEDAHFGKDFFVVLTYGMAHLSKLRRIRLTESQSSLKVVLERVMMIIESFDMLGMMSPDDFCKLLNYSIYEYGSSLTWEFLLGKSVELGEVMATAVRKSLTGHKTVKFLS